MAARTFTTRNIVQSIATCMLVAAIATAAHAEDAYYHDTQWFSPVELDFNYRPLRKSCGYFFNYDRLNWAATGERTTIGDNSQVVWSEQIFKDTTYSQGTAPPQYQIFNGIQDAPPFAEFSWGTRYELGYFDRNSGIMVGVLDGPRITSKAVYGFQQVAIPNTLPIANQLDPTVSPNFATAFTADGVTYTGTADIPTTQNGFGSVHVNFATPAGYLLGFRDYHINGGDEENGYTENPTTGGPGYQVTTVTVANGEITAITVTNGADGIVDNLDGDDSGTFYIVLGLDPEGEEVPIGNGVDFDDLHLFNIRFDTLSVRNTTVTKGVELMRTHELSNRHLPVKRQDDRLSIAYGVRYLQLKDLFTFEGTGDLLGRTYANTSVENQIVGPQIRAMWQTQLRDRLFLNLDGRFMFGYNIQDLDQVGAIGENLNPGGLNSLVAAQPTAFSYGRRDDTFAPLIEFRAEGSYQVTSSIALKLGYTAVFVDNITRASESVRWYLPDMGLLSSGDQDILINGATFGVELVH